MTFTYTNPSNEEGVWVGDVFIKPEGSIVKNQRNPSFEQAVKNGTLALTVSGAVEKPHGGFTVLFDRMEHGTVPQPVRNVLANAKITLPEMTADGFTFKGWFKDRDFTQEFTANSEVTGNITLYAKWTVDDDPELEAAATPAAGEVAADPEVQK